MATETQVFRLDLDSADFIEGLKSSKEALEKLGGKSDSLDALISGIGTATALVGTMAVAFIAAKTALDWTEQAEQIRQVETQFEMLAEQAGISGSKLKEGMITAAAGTISETELLKLSNKAMVELGDNAVKIPQIMELARKATAIFGGDAASTFEQINQAIASGNTRMLRHIGIKIDAQLAEKEYAKSIGTTVDALSQSGKQAAIMEAVLKQGSDQFKNVNADALQTATTMKQVKAAVTDAGEAFLLAFEKKAGPAIKFFVDQLKQGALWLKKAFSPDDVDDLNKHLDQAQQHLISLQNRMVELNNGGTVTDKIFGNVEASKKTIAAQIQATKDAINEINTQKRILNKPTESAVSGESEETKANKIDLELQKAQRTAFGKDLQKLKDQELKAAIANERSIADVDRNLIEQKKQINEDYEQKVKELKARADAGKIDSNQLEQALLIQKKLRDAEDLKLEEDKTDRKIAAVQRFADVSKSNADQFAAGWKKSTLSAEQDTKNFSTLGATAFSTIGSKMSAAFAAMGSGSKTAGQAMSEFFIGAIGSMASAAGNFFLLKGLALSADPTAPGSGIPMMAEGAALIALGGLLGAAGSSSSASSGGGGGSSSATAATPNGSTSPAPPIGSSGPGKQLTVQIMGSLFETDETKQRLMDMIRQETDSNGFAYKQVGV